MCHEGYSDLSADWQELPWQPSSLPGLKNGQEETLCMLRIGHLDGAVGLASLPVPEPELALSVTTQHVAAIW